MARLLYPEDRNIDDSAVIEWAKDVQYNKNFAEWVANGGDPDDYDVVQPLLSLQEAKDLLVDEGHAEFGTRLKKLTRNERLQAAADAGYDTWEELRGER